MNYAELTTSELIQLKSIDTSKFLKEVDHYKLRHIINELDILGTYERYSFIILGKHKINLICKGFCEYEINIEPYAKFLEREGYNYTEINEKFNIIKAKRASLLNITLSILDADDIASVYDEDFTYFTHRLAGSCMRGQGYKYQNLVDNLVDKEDMKIAVIRGGEGSLLGRSLVWHNKYYDKTYCNSDSLDVLFRQKLKEAGYYDIEDNGNYEDVVISFREGIVGNEVPYMDNVCYFHHRTQTLIADTSGSDYIEFQDCDGYVWDIRTCSCCCNRYREDNMYVLANGDYCCDECVDDEKVVYCKDTEEYNLVDDCIYTVDTRNWFSYTDELYYAEDTNEYYEDYDNVYYAEDTGIYYSSNYDLFYVEDLGCYYEDDIDLYLVDGYYYKEEPTDEYKELL